MDRKVLFGLGFTVVFSLFPQLAGAVALSQGKYEQGKDIIITSKSTSGEVRIGFFNAATGVLINMIGLDDSMIFPVSLIGEIGEGEFAQFVVGQYSAVEFVFDGPPDCDQVSYGECLNLSDFKGEARFEVTQDAPGGARIHTPVVKISAPLGDQILSKQVAIQYEASDEDDVTGQKDHGLKEKPVNIYYGLPRSFDWILIARDQPATGTVIWDTSVLPDGPDYRIKATVTGRDDDFYQVVFYSITLDNTLPHFEVKATPLFSKGDPVGFEIESSEVLKAPPVVIVAQANHEPVKIDLTGNLAGRKFKGTYNIISGFDGLAAISVSGEDKAGNKGTTILGNDYFSVGFEPPPAPTVQTPENNWKTAKTLLPLVAGLGVNAEIVTLKVNGQREFSTKDINRGQFRFENVPLDPRFNKGKNQIQLVSHDPSGAVSPPAALEIFVNSPPEIVLVEPRGFTNINGLARFNWKSFDVNDDTLTYQVDLSEDRGRTWKTLGSGLKTQEYVWDSTKVPDGSNYLFRVTASDGTLVTAASSERINVLNNLPAIVLESSGELFTREASKTFQGSVRSKADLLVKLELSVNGGKAWQESLPQDGAWDETFEQFAFSVPALGAGAHDVILRGHTKSGRTVVNAERLRVVFDDEPPRLFLERLEDARPTAKRVLEMNGIAYDDVSGIKAIEYSVDDSKWFQGSLTQVGSRNLEFTVAHPEPLRDGTHQVRVRAIDRAGNISPVSTQSITVDATAPRIGSFTLRSQGALLFPDRLEGDFRILPKTPLEFRMAIRGKPKKAKLFADNRALTLIYNSSSGLWESSFQFGAEGLISLKAEAEDELGNKNERDLAKISVSQSLKSVRPKETRPGLWQRFLNALRSQ